MNGCRRILTASHGGWASATRQRHFWCHAQAVFPWTVHVRGARCSEEIPWIVLSDLYKGSCIFVPLGFIQCSGEASYDRVFSHRIMVNVKGLLVRWGHREFVDRPVVLSVICSSCCLSNLVHTRNQDLYQVPANVPGTSTSSNGAPLTAIPNTAIGGFSNTRT